MNFYKISKDYWSTIQKFATLEDAQAFADSLGEGYTAEFYAPYTPPSIQERLQMDMQFGQDLVFVFVEVKAVREEEALDVSDSPDHCVIFESVHGIPLGLVEELHVIKAVQVELRPLRVLVVDLDELAFEIPGLLF